MELRTKYTGGHTETILCVCASATNHLATGSENNQLCLWDQMEGKIVHKVQPHRGAGTEPSEGDLTSLCFSRTQPYNLYCAVDTHIYLYDTRCMESSVAHFECNKEEINQLALHPKDTFLAACDDSGQVRIIDVNQRKPYKTLRKHTNICSSVTFHPKLPWHVATGGLDCSIFTWDFSRGHVFNSLSTQDLDFEDASSVPSSYTLNPPMVHSVQYSPTGELACGLENATVNLLEFPKRNEIRVKKTLRGHTQGVSQVCFHGNDLLSAGNDGKIILWNTSSDVTDEKENLEEGPQMKGESSTGAASNHVISERETGKGSDIRHVLDHGDKINWMCPVQWKDENLLYIADQSDVVSVYKLS